MGLMASFERGMERFLVPVAIKLNSQKHVAAVRDGFVFTFPIIMASSLIILINFAILSPDGFIAGLLHLNSIFPNLEKAQAIFTPVMNGSVNIMSIMIAFLVARNVAISYEQDDLLCGLTAIGAFFIVYTPYQMIDGQAFLTTKYLGAQGLFVAVIVALITSEIFCRLARNPKITITMPAAVPPAVARSFKVLLPIFFVMVFFSALNYCLTLISPAGLNDLIYTLIQTPLKHMGTNIFAVIILGAVGNFLWVLGIHGPNTTSAIRETVFSEANLENLSWAAQHGTTWGAPYPITWTSINDAFANCGGSGMTLGLLLAIFIASKRAEYRDLAKMSFIPGIFNINEPIMFGLPIVLNPIMMVPFIMVPIVNCAIGYFFVSMEIIPPVAYAVPWTTPGPLIAFLGTGGNWLALLVGFLWVAGRYQNTGQVCAAAKRFIIEEGIASAFTERFVAAAAALKMGDPRDEENALGPMARFDLRDELHHQVEKTLAQGARLLLGGEKMAGAGNYYPPTVLANVTPEMTAFREEMFGPVAAITIAKDAEHALELANDSEFGLSATIFTTDETQARQMAARLECGGVFINGYCASDARVAFGGVKKSGFGRELSHFGLHEFCNIQTVWKDRV